MNEITSRRQAKREGSIQGHWTHVNRIHGSVLDLALNAVQGKGPNARVIPERWAKVFMKSFVRTARPNRKRKGAPSRG